MNVGQLKQSLARFAPDKDNTEVVFMFNVDGKDRVEDTAFVAYAELPEERGLVCILGTMSTAIDRMKKGTLKYPDNYKPADTGIDLSTGASN